MALLIPDGYAQVLLPIKHSGVARSAAVTWGIKNNTGGFWTPSVADDAMAAFTNNINLDSNCTIGPAQLRVTAPGGGTGTIGGTISQPGAAVSVTPPPNVATLAKKVTARLGRRGTGRMFLPWFLDESNIDETGTITPAVVTAVNVDLEDFRDALALDNIPMYLLHDSDGVTPAPDPDEVVALLCDTRVGTQRRRLRG